MNDIADLVRLAGPRPEPAAFRAARVREAVEAEWRRTLRRRSRGTVWRWGLAVAAAASLTLLWIQPTRRPATLPPADVATVLRVDGAVRLASSPTAARPLATGDRLAAGETADTTGGGRLSLVLGGGIALRVKEGSRVAIEEPSKVRLERGTIYVDTGSAAPAVKRMEVATALGTVLNVGTRFEVGAGLGAVHIRVREGEVRVERAGPAVRVIAAEAVTLHTDQRVDRAPAPPFGPDWAWVESLAAPFVVEGATLETFLDWVSRELGVTWRYADRAAERHGDAVVLHGSIDGLTPREALDAILPTCGMSQRTIRGQLIVARTAR